MSAASDRTAYLRYCNTSAKTTCVCCPKMVGIDPSNNTVCLDPSCNSIVASIDPNNNTVALDLTTGLGDAFSRLRVSNPYTLFEFTSISGKQPTIIDEFVSPGIGATSTWVSGDSYVNMAVTNLNETVIRQSHDYIPYQPGKSRLVLMTGVLIDNPISMMVTTRIGTYDTTIGGIYIEFKNGIYSVNLADLIGSTIVTTTKTRDQWDDLLNGTGPSGITVDFSKAQIFLFDFEWLGVGQVRCGIVQGGNIYYYYTFTNINALVAPYIQMAKLPLRYEIISNGAANSMRMICGTVISEGGFSPPGRQFILSTDVSADSATLANSNVFRPIMGLSLRTGNPFNRGTIKLEGIDIFDLDANVAGSWKVLLNPTMTYTPTWVDYDTITSPAQGSIARFFRAPKAMSVLSPIITNEGQVLYQGYFYNRSTATFITSVDELVAAKGIASDIAGTPDVLVLVINWLAGSNNTDVYCKLRWAEIM